MVDTYLVHPGLHVPAVEGQLDQERLQKLLVSMPKSKERKSIP